VDLPHSWDGLENVNKEFNSYGKRASKDNICNGEGSQLIEFCESNIFDILNGKHEADINTNRILRGSTKTYCSPTSARWFLHIFIAHLAQLANYKATNTCKSCN
jgi:hypothetical protein